MLNPALHVPDDESGGQGWESRSQWPASGVDEATILPHAQNLEATTETDSLISRCPSICAP